MLAALASYTTVRHFKFLASSNRPSQALLETRLVAVRAIFSADAADDVDYLDKGVYVSARQHVRIQALDTAAMSRAEEQMRKQGWRNVGADKQSLIRDCDKDALVAEIELPSSGGATDDTALVQMTWGNADAVCLRSNQ